MIVATGLRLVANVCAVDVQMGAVIYWSVMLIVCAPVIVPAVTVIEFVPCPAVIVHPPGTTHIYCVTPPIGSVGGVATTENTFPVELLQT